MKAFGLSGTPAVVFTLLATVALVLLAYLGWLIGQSARDGPPVGASPTPSQPPPVEVAIVDCAVTDGESVPTPDGLHVVHEIALDVESPSGLVYLPGSRTLGVVNSADSGALLHQVSLFGDAAGTSELPVDRADAVATGAAADADLVALDRIGRILSLVSRSPSGAIEAVVDTIDLRSADIGEITALDVDPRTQEIVVADSADQRLIRIPMRDLPRGRSGIGELIGACGADIQIDDIAGMAVHPSDGHVFTVSADGAVLREHDPAGRLLSERPMTDLLLPQITGLAFGPTADVTDAEDAQHLYLLTTESGSSAIVGVSFDAAPAPPAAAPRVPGALAARIGTSELSPPSSDPGGIAFDRANNRLIITDSEIDELPEFAGHTIFELRADGTWSGLGELRLSDEITDVAIDADGGRWFFSDDSAKQIIEVSLGPDEEFGTADDGARLISTAQFGSLDPEGIAFGQGSIFISDGVAAEIYRLSPGPDGIFNGVAPAGDDTVQHFDTARLGIGDPEGIAFDPDRGTLYLRGRDRREPIVEAATDGAPIVVIELDRELVRSAGGIELWPASDGSGALHLMIADRGADSGRSDVPNDGQLLEIRFDRPASDGG